MEYKEMLMRVIAENVTALENVDERILDQFVEELAARRNQHIVGYAAGRMGYGLRAFIMRLRHLGFDAHWYGDTTIPHLNAQDMFIFASGSGKTESILNILDIAKRKSGARIALLTGDVESPMAKKADLVMKFKTCNNGLNSENSPDKINSIQPMTTLNEQASFLLFDIISLKLMERLHEDNGTMSIRHNCIE